MKNSQSLPKVSLSCLGMLLTLFIGVATDVFANRNASAFVTYRRILAPLTQIMDAMIKMMERMKTLPMSGNADTDFAMMMKEHHQGAIQMAKVQIQMGKNQALKDKAKQVIAKQSTDTEKLDSYLQKENKTVSNSAHTQHSGNKKSENSMFSKMISTAMDKMNQLMQKEKSSDDIDHQFATLMSIHHQGAIDMSQAEIDHGASASLKQLAKTTIADSKKDMEELQTLLKKHHTK
jgi:uncharacterized protein (DUF305 family)